MKSSWHRKYGTTGKSEATAFAKGDIVWQFTEACYCCFWVRSFFSSAFMERKRKAVWKKLQFTVTEHGHSASFLINFQIQEIHSSRFWNAGKLTEELQRAGKAKAFKIVADELIRGSKKQLNLCADNSTTVSGMYKHSTFFFLLALKFDPSLGVKKSHFV